jgi:hypothetical protein
MACATEGDILKLYTFSGPPVLDGTTFQHFSARRPLRVEYIPNHRVKRLSNGTVIIVQRRWRPRFRVLWEGMPESDACDLINILENGSFDFTPRPLGS